MSIVVDKVVVDGILVACKFADVEAIGIALVTVTVCVEVVFVVDKVFGDEIVLVTVAVKGLNVFVAERKVVVEVGIDCGVDFDIEIDDGEFFTVLTVFGIIVFAIIVLGITVAGINVAGMIVAGIVTGIVAGITVAGIIVAGVIVAGIVTAITSGIIVVTVGCVIPTFSNVVSVKESVCVIILVVFGLVGFEEKMFGDVVNFFELSFKDLVVNSYASVAASELAEITVAVMALSYVDGLIV